MIKPNRTVQVCRTTIHQPRRPPTSPRIRGITDYGFRTDVAYLNNSTFRAVVALHRKRGLPCLRVGMAALILMDGGF